MTVLLGTPTPPLARKSGKYTCLNLLGQGTYGTCYKVLEKPKSTPCVMKVIPLSDLKTHDVQAAFSEAMLLSTIKHPHVVGYLDAWVENSHLYIVMEYCRGGDLGLLLRGRQLSILEVLQYGRDMACGMQHLHAHRIMHRYARIQICVFISRLEMGYSSEEHCGVSTDTLHADSSIRANMSSTPAGTSNPVICSFTTTR